MIWKNVQWGPTIMMRTGITIIAIYLKPVPIYSDVPTRCGEGDCRNKSRIHTSLIAELFLDRWLPRNYSGASVFIQNTDEAEKETG